MTIKTAADIRHMEQVGRLAAQTLVHVSKFVKAGITTDELDKIAYDFILTNDAKPAPLGYHGYPKSICTSVNHCICHGVPDNTVLKDGDIINVDVTALKFGFHGDCSATYFVGEVSEKAKQVTQVALDARDRGIEAIRPFGTTGDIGFEINKLVTRAGLFVVHEIGGHGIGREFHEEPFVPSFGKKGRGDKLLPWGCITVEPMINETDSKLIEFSIPRSTIKYYETGDKSLSAQFEHTVLITDTGYQILTLP